MVSGFPTPGQRARARIAKGPESPYDYAPFTNGFQELSMANTAQARKRARQSETRRVHNTSQRSELRSAVKSVKKAIASGDKAAAAKALQDAASTVDRIADKKIIHKNKAARHKSRLSKAIKAMK
jgi:small subunit ribosomal protein S20